MSYEQLAPYSGTHNYHFFAFKMSLTNEPIKWQNAGSLLGSVSSRECLDAPTILATITAGRTGLVACPWRRYNFNNYGDNPHVICLNFICFFFTVLKKSEMRKVCLKRPRKSVKIQEKDEISLNYVAHSAPQISGGLSLIGQSKK